MNCTSQLNVKDIKDQAMSNSKSQLWTCSLQVFLRALTFCQLVNAADDHLSVLNKDVVIIGGGASGTYAAVRLREDYEKSVFLVEMEAVLVRDFTHYR